MTTEFKLTPDQNTIFKDVNKKINTHPGRYDCVIKGPAGTGKSTVISRIIHKVAYGYTVAVTSPTHKANRVLNNMLTDAGVDMDNVDVMTIHSFLGLKLVWKEDKQVLELDNASKNSRMNVDVLVIDECSMVSHDLYMHVMTQAHRVRRAIIFIGDECQLPPVETESKVDTVISVSFKHGVVYELTKVLRQALDNPIICLATEIRQCIGANQDPMQFFYNLPANYDTIIPAYDLNDFLDSYIETINSTSADEIMENVLNNKVLSYTNNNVDLCNMYIRQYIYPNATDELFQGEPIVFDEVTEKSPFSVQEVAKCPMLQKDVWFGIECWKMHYEGSTFYVVGPETKVQYKEKLNDIIRKIRISETNPLTKKPFMWADYYIIKEKIGIVSYPYASTFHKSQGSTFDNVWLDFQYVNVVRNFDDKARMIYTAVTRPRHAIIASI